VKILNKSKNFK